MALLERLRRKFGRSEDEDSHRDLERLCSDDGFREIEKRHELLARRIDETLERHQRRDPPVREARAR